MNVVEVVDVLEGFAALTRRDGTLGGGVPLRAAQACTPLLEGNAFGLQVGIQKPVNIERRVLRTRVEGIDPGTSKRCRALLPMLAARGLVTAAFLRKFADGPVSLVRERLEIFTGLLVRPETGVRLRVTRSANRGFRTLSFSGYWIEEPRFSPLVLRFDFRSETRTVVVGANAGTLLPLPSETPPVHELALNRAGDLIDRYLGFYDASYFQTKKSGRASKKYRREITTKGLKRPPSDEPAFSRFANLGPASLVPTDSRSLVVKNAVPFSASFDGHEVRVEPDEEMLGSFSKSVRAKAQPFFDERAHEHPGALLYLSKYFTPHPVGEPHFFVKPPALLQTPPGWSSLIEGECGAGFEVMRGVVATDQFHAIPAVFNLLAPGKSIRMAKGEPLAEVFPFPRTMQAATFTTCALAELLG